MERKSIMVFDGDVDSRVFLERCLKRAGHRTEVLERVEDLICRLNPSVHALAITTLVSKDAERIRRLEELTRRVPAVPLLVVVDHDETGEAVAAMKAGAFGYCGKPYIEDQVLLLVDKAIEQRRLQEEISELRGKALRVERPIICESHAMRRLIEIVDRVALSDATVLVLGECGTGKELVARRIHARSRRCGRPFVAVNCTALPAALLEADLLGQIPPACGDSAQDRPGKFGAAEGGTLFLDEISGLSIPLQGRLLRALQERELHIHGRDEPVSFDLRIVAAADQDIRRMVASGEFRNDLFYRLNVIELRVPSLGARWEDIPLLVRHFLRRASGGRDVHLPEEVLGALSIRHWPQNVRELQDVCVRLARLAKGREVRLSDLSRAARSRSTSRGSRAVSPLLDEQSLRLPPEGFYLGDFERRVVDRALDLNGWNVSETARYLKVPRHILTYRMRKHGLRRSSEMISG